MDGTAPRGPAAARLRQRRWALRRQFELPEALEEMLPGALSLVHLRCGKPTCHCATGEGHHLTSHGARGRAAAGDAHSRRMGRGDPAAGRGGAGLSGRGPRDARGERAVVGPGAPAAAEGTVGVGRAQVAAYLEKVFEFSALVAQLPEGRQHPQHSCQKVFEAVFWGAMGRIASFHQLEYECRAGRLRHHIGPLSEDTCRYALERLAPEAVFALGCAVARQLKRNGVLRTAATRGMVVAAVDGIEICRSGVRWCAACQERTIERVVDGGRREERQYYHRLVAVVVVSTPCPIVLGIRFQAPGEAEVTCALALVRVSAHRDRPFRSIVITCFGPS